MHLLILYAHPGTHTFSHHVLQAIVEEAQHNGHETRIRDLYHLQFDPVLQLTDLSAARAGNPDSQIREEQEFIRWADVVIFIYPVWWGGMPAILKGYIDRVFLSGFAYVFREGLHQPLLGSKKAMVFATQGTSLEEYQANGMTEAMIRINDTGIFEFCGIQSLGHTFFVQNSMADIPRLERNIARLRAVLSDALPPVLVKA